MTRVPWSDQEKAILWGTYGSMTLKAIAARIERDTGTVRTPHSIRRMANQLGLQSSLDGALSVSEVIRQLGTTKFYVYRALRTGKVKTHRIGKFRYIDADDIEELRQIIENQAVGETDKMTLGAAAKFLGYERSHLGRLVEQHGVSVEVIGRAKYLTRSQVEGFRKMIQAEQNKHTITLTRAAELLGFTRPYFSELIKKHGIQIKRRGNSYNGYGELTSDDVENLRLRLVRSKT